MIHLETGQLLSTSQACLSFFQGCRCGRIWTRLRQNSILRQGIRFILKTFINIFLKKAIKLQFIDFLLIKCVKKMLPAWRCSCKENKCSNRSMEVLLTDRIGNNDRPTGGRPNDQPDRPTNGRIDWVIGKLHFHKYVWLLVAFDVIR